MTTLHGLDLSPYRTTISRPAMSAATEHILFCQSQGLSPNEVLESLGADLPGDWSDVFLALDRLTEAQVHRRAA